ncbi:MAG: type II/IV secretion system protein [Kiritimatiellae bacterium]|nr:type II/IV secretion system protein [Kiritimatiellia bacterium]
MIPSSPSPASIPDEALRCDLLDAVKVDWARKNAILPVMQDGRLVYAGGPSTPESAFEDLSLLLGSEAPFVRMDEDALRRAIDRAYFLRSRPAGGEETDEDAAAADADAGSDAAAEDQDLLLTSDEAPVARAVNTMLLEAVRQGASDIHVEPFARGVTVRYRIDGLLYSRPAPPRALAAAFTARLKVMAKMDLAERRLPQDGVARVRVGEKALDVRVSSVPVAEGERIVLRLLRRESAFLGLRELGMGEDILLKWNTLIHSPNGILFVTGPTGSGKTTTLYAALRAVDTAHLNVLTVEDPVEYELDGIGQIQVHPKIGLTFASGLRHILRQDPDVVLVGETRDPETAEIVTRASLTGHLVFTTLHTNDAPGAVERMVDMGVPPYLLASAVKGILSQRLVRLLCPHCREETRLAGKTAEAWGRPEAEGRTVYRAHEAGCAHCIGGYRGRTGLHELLMVDARLAERMRERVPRAALVAQAAAETGFRPLVEDGRDKILSGLTSEEEVRRACGA